MNSAAIIYQATADGVVLTLSQVGTIKARGKQEAVNRWISVIREHKTEVIELLRRETRPTQVEVDTELRRLVHVVAALHGFTAEEEVEALNNDLIDFDAALTCFRSLTREGGIFLK